MENHETNSIILEVRKKLDIVQVISQYVSLVKKGKNYFGVCPFHDDTNPSMSVSPEKQIYRCFSCGASGNVFSFVQEFEHLSFKETLYQLAEKAGVQLQNISYTKKNDQYDKFYEIYQISHNYYLNNLQTNLGKKAKAYLHERSISDEMIKEFQIGLSLDIPDDLIQLLIKKGYNLSDLNMIGLANSNRDLYCSRIMFPLKDLSGRIVGFSGRRYDGIKDNKYVNTKGTPIFQKGTILYNYFDAREAIRKKNQVLLMEGFMAAIRSITVGVKNVVSLMGTAMTKEQVDLLKRLSNNVVLCLDGDDPGREATLLNGEELEKKGFNVRVVELSDGLDPDDYILKYGADSFRSLIENAISFSDFKIRSLRKGVNFSSDKEVSNYINQVLIEASKITDEIRRELILKTLAKDYDIGYNTLEKRLSTYLEKTPKKESSPPVQIVIKPKTLKHNKYELAEWSLLYYMLINHTVRNWFELGKFNFSTEQERFLASEIIYYYKLYGTLVPADFYTYLQDKKELLNLLNHVLALELEDEVSDQAIEQYIRVVRENSVNLEIERLKKTMSEKNDPLEKARIAERIRKLKMGSG
ncbi:MAG: DNA primase [Bacilli bacterium]|nr:DNA primase [Bacilli bacterium]